MTHESLARKAIIEMTMRARLPSGSEVWVSAYRNNNASDWTAYLNARNDGGQFIFEASATASDEENAVHELGVALGVLA